MNELSAQYIVALFNTPNKALELNLTQWSKFIFVLRECGLLARFYFIAEKDDCFTNFPVKVKHHLNSAKIKSERQNKQAIFEASEITSALQDINVIPVFLKGVAYDIKKSPASLGRIYSDMDILVEKTHLKGIERRLTLFGWFTKIVDDYDDKYYREWAHEIPPMQHSSRGTVADIHHNLLPPISGKAPDIKKFTQKLYTTTSGLTTLSDPAMTLHSIIHLFFNEDFSHGFRDITDLHLIFSSQYENSEYWSTLLSLSIETKFSTELFYAVRYCKEITQTKFPQIFLEKINHFQPSHFKVKFADFIFQKVLLPTHPSCATKHSQFAHFLALFRGHILKMPLHILLYHSLRKLLVTVFKPFNNKSAI